MSNQGNKHAHDADGNRLRTMALAGVIATLLASAVGMLAVARAVDRTPKVGDILVFRLDARLPIDWEFAAVNSSDQLPVSCKLQPAVMASSGGSLVVEQRSPNRRMYRVHWAGSRTNLDGSDCGTEADLLLARADLQLLANIVGGPGVERKRFAGL